MKKAADNKQIQYDALSTQRDLKIPLRISQSCVIIQFAGGSSAYTEE